MFTTNGRIGRLRYLGWSMAMTLCFLVIMGLGFLLGETVGVAVTALASIAFIVIAVMIGVQRLHDLGWSGWLWLLNFVPFVGSVFGILMLVLPGSTGANRYGPPPPANSTGESPGQSDHPAADSRYHRRHRPCRPTRVTWSARTMTAAPALQPTRTPRTSRPPQRRPKR